MRGKAYIVVFVFALLTLFGWSGYGQDTKGARQSEVPQAGVRFPAGKSFVEVPLEVERNLTIIPVRINNSRPLRLVLDTGANSTHLENPEIADSLNFNFTGDVTVRGAGQGSIIAKKVDGVSFNVGGVETVGMLLVEPRKPTDFERLSDDGTIGRQLFDRFIVEFDWIKRFIKLHDPTKYTYSGKGSILPLTFDQAGRAYTTATAVISDNTSIPVKLVVDTGASTALGLDVGTHPAIKVPKRAINTVIGRGVGGEITGDIGRVERFQLGNYVLKDVITNFPDASQRVGGVGGRQGRLGAEVLQKFKVIFDFPQKRMIIEPNKNFKEPFEYSMTGFATERRRLQKKELKIIKVMENSPAHQAGLLAQDEISAINQRPMSSYTVDDLNRMFRQNGKQLMLTVRRDDKEFRTRIKLRRIL